MSIHVEYDHQEIPYQSFWDIGMYLFNKWNEPKINMNLVLSELVALHQCRTEKLYYFEKKELCSDYVSSDKSSDKSSDNSRNNSSDKNSDKSSDKNSEKSSDNSVKITSLHECNKIKSINSDICSLCSDDTDNTIFKYYISDDEINIEAE
jgi:hypothetical protein